MKKLMSLVPASYPHETFRHRNAESVEGEKPGDRKKEYAPVKVLSESQLRRTHMFSLESFVFYSKWTPSGIGHKP
ncbi:MAG: hypothetical protein Tsb009_16610 [Planctomycetaceae bacterium]